MDADPLWGPCESDMALGSPHEADESTKMALDVACETARIAVEGHVVVVTAAIWEIPDYTVLDNMPRGPFCCISSPGPDALNSA